MTSTCGASDVAGAGIAGAVAQADLLRVSALLAPDEIPEELLTEGGAEGGPVLAAALASDG